MPLCIRECAIRPYSAGRTPTRSVEIVAKLSTLLADKYQLPGIQSFAVDFLRSQSHANTNPPALFSAAETIYNTKHLEKGPFLKLFRSSAADALRLATNEQTEDIYETVVRGASLATELCKVPSQTLEKAYSQYAGLSNNSTVIIRVKG